MNSKILKISPQGQLTIPKQWRNKVISGEVNEVLVKYNAESNTITIDNIPSNKEEWIQGLKGSIKEGKEDSAKYINKLRNEWDKDNDNDI